MKQLSRMKCTLALCFLLTGLIPSASLASFAATAPKQTPELLYADEEVEIAKQELMDMIYRCMCDLDNVRQLLEGTVSKAEAPELYERAETIEARIQEAENRIKQITTMDEVSDLQAMINDIRTQIENLEVQIEVKQLEDMIYRCMYRFDTVCQVLASRVSKDEAPELYEQAENIRARIQEAENRIKQITTMEEVWVLQALINDLSAQIEDLSAQIYKLFFIATTLEGIEMEIRIVSEEEKTAVVVSLGYHESYCTITIPEEANGYTIIGFNRAFQNTSVGTVILPPTIKSISEDAFSNCRNLTTVNIPTSVTIIESNAFYRCSSLESIDIPNSVIAIGEGAFAYSGLTSIRIPNSVITMGRDAFQGCDYMTEVRSMIKEPFIIEQSVFPSIVYELGILYVPAGTKALYEATEGWNQFQDIIEMEENLAGDVNNDGQVGIGDIVAVTNVMAGITTDEATKQRANVNGDGQVGIGDIVAITNIMAGISGTTEPSYLSCPDANHPHWIDLGLPSGTQWRCCNEGASTPEAFGGYYQFGRVSTAPTREQIKELVNNCSYAWTTQNGVNGGKFTGPNGGSIFLPAAGVIEDGEHYDVGSFGYYWSSTLSVGNPWLAWYIFFGSEGADVYYDGRIYGQSVRPVR